MRLRLFLLLAACIVFVGALRVPFYPDDLQASSQPLTALTFQLQMRLNGEPWSYHLVNLLLHLTCVWLVVPVLEDWLESVPVRIAAAVFAIHPLQTEAVVNISARGTLLAALFALLCIRDWQSGRLWRSVVWFAAAIASHESVVALPLVLALSEWAVEKRQHAWRPLVFMAAIGVVFLAASASISFQRAAFQGVAMLRHLWLMLIPLGYTPVPAIRTGPWAASLAWGVIASLCVLTFSTARGRKTGFYLLAGLLMLVPSSLLLPSQELTADRQMYLPLAFLGPMLGLVLQRADFRLLSALALIWGGASFLQTSLWQNPQALWMEVARLAPDAPMPKRRLAPLLPAPQAVELLDEAARLQPDEPGIQLEIGAAWLRAGEPPKAKDAFEKALVLDPCSSDAVARLQSLGVEAALPRHCGATSAQSQ